MTHLHLDSEPIQTEYFPRDAYNAPQAQLCTFPTFSCLDKTLGLFISARSARNPCVCGLRGEAYCTIEVAAVCGKIRHHYTQRWA